MTSGIKSEEFLKRHEVTLVGKNGVLKKITVRGGSNLWVAIRKAGVPIGAACSGVGVCAACDVTIAPSAGVSSMTAFESAGLARNFKEVSHVEGSQVRLSCLCRVLSSISIKADYW